MTAYRLIVIRRLTTAPKPWATTCRLPHCQWTQRFTDWQQAYHHAINHIRHRHTKNHYRRAA